MTVVGESFRERHIEQIAGGRTAEGAKYRWHTAQLVQEDTNPFDRGNAVMVLIGGVLVGYIPAEDCPRVRAAMSRLPGAPVTVRALISGGWLPGTDDRTGFGVVLYAHDDLRPFDPSRDGFLPGDRLVTVTALKPEIEQAASRTLTPVAHLAPSGAGLLVGSDGAWWGALTKAMVDRYIPLLRTVGQAKFPVTAACRLTMTEGKRRAHLMLPRESEVGRLIETADRA